MAPPPSTSVSATDSPESTTDTPPSAMLNYRRIPHLVPICKDLSASALAQSTPARQLLQTQMDDASATVPVSRTLNSRPVIGILTHPGDGASGRLNNSPNVSYIAASYSKFVESAGARVIPLIYNEPWEVLQRTSGVLSVGCSFSSSEDIIGSWKSAASEALCSGSS
ncbi:hypothetical protein SASPL_152473 [Salvia splendens]|uniref:Folate gamma-glutamyl hydrolase n=1 Tax=Salvia splendens TaxID=180675 RepID=A0A8X8W3Y6_SALSN|nr:hypothetical protein SASPL_152473 [Salvia splendens]